MVRKRNVTAVMCPTSSTVPAWSSHEGGLASSEKPPEIWCDVDTASVESTSGPSEHSTTCLWGRPHVSQPVIDSFTVLSIGGIIFALALFWPPLLLLAAYGASKLMTYAFRENDDAAMRRQLYAQFCQEADELPKRFRNIDQFVLLEDTFWTNERGMVLSTTIMRPRKQKVVAVVCYCHGYTDHVSFSKRVEFQRLCDSGLAFIAIEYEGHGRSDGALGLIPDWEDLVHDVASYFQQVTQAHFPHHKVFLMGESMGGAVAYSVYNRVPALFSGVVFVCPMCKISDDMLPHPFVIQVLKWLIGPSGCPTTFLGFLPLAPCRNSLACLTHRIPEKALQNAQCPLNYGRNPRLATARELIDVTQRIGASLSDFAAPFLVLHGTEDRVTDPRLSQALYNESTSTDKSIRLYQGMWHSLTCGESDANIDLVFRDVISWILARVESSQPRL